MRPRNADFHPYDISVPMRSISHLLEQCIISTPYRSLYPDHHRDTLDMPADDFLDGAGLSPNHKALFHLGMDILDANYRAPLL